MTQAVGERQPCTGCGARRVQVDYDEATGWISLRPLEGSVAVGAVEIAMEFTVRGEGSATARRLEARHAVTAFVRERPSQEIRAYVGSRQRLTRRLREQIRESNAGISPAQGGAAWPTGATPLGLLVQVHWSFTWRKPPCGCMHALNFQIQFVVDEATGQLALTDLLDAVG